MNLDLARSLAAEITADLQQLVLKSQDLTEALKPNVVVPAGGNLQAALDAAKPGDTIELLPGVVYTGVFTLPAKTGNVTVTTQGFAADRRVDPTDAPVLATLRSGTLDKTIDGTNAANWTFSGVRFESRSDGLGEVILLQDAVNIMLDRILLVAGTNGQKRAIRGNGQGIILTRSYIANCWRTGQDSQAFCAWDGAGPYTITDNYLEAASENVMFGGADSKSVDRIPSDILIENNLFTKNLAWKGVAGYAVKNLLEFKVGKRVTVRNNTFNNNWTDAQTGWSILFKSVNQNGTAPWSVTDGVVFENNIVSGVERGINIQGETFEANSNGTTQHGGRTTNIVIRGNQISTDREATQMTGGAGVITVDANVFQQGLLTNNGNVLTLDGPKLESITWTNNQWRNVPYGIKGTGTTAGTASLAAYTVSYIYMGNTIV